MYDHYPPGMSTADLIHVGEIADPRGDWDKFIEDFEPKDHMLHNHISESPESVLKIIEKFKDAYNELVEEWKENNMDEIGDAYNEQ